MRVAVTPWLRQLEAALAVARRGDDPEGVHQVRVALARIRLWLWLSGRRALRDDAHWLRSAARGLRDLDVRLSLAPPHAEAVRLQRLHAAEQRELLAALGSDRTKALLDALDTLPALPRALAVKRMRRLAVRVLARGREAEARPHDIAALHELRCAVRRLRYALECVGRPSQPVSQLQTSLGEACDCAVALGRRRARSPHERQLAQRRDCAEQLARKEWKALRHRLERLAARGA